MNYYVQAGFFKIRSLNDAFCVNYLDIFSQPTGLESTLCMVVTGRYRDVIVTGRWS